MAAPDDAEGGKDVDVDVGEGTKGTSEFGDGRRGDVIDARGGVREPRVGEDLGNLGRSRRSESKQRIKGM